MNDVNLEWKEYHILATCHTGQIRYERGAQLAEVTIPHPQESSTLDDVRATIVDGIQLSFSCCALVYIKPCTLSAPSLWGYNLHDSDIHSQSSFKSTAGVSDPPSSNNDNYEYFVADI